MIMAVQSKMARAALGWGVRDVAKAAGVNVNTVSRFEGGQNVTVSTIERIRAAFEAAGVKFLKNGGVEPPKESGE
jgi:transcriptional regulator with XRE-family HTH domain